MTALTLAKALGDWVQDHLEGANDAEPAPILMVAGAQGCGKTTALAEVATRFGDRVVVVGLDDFYLSNAERHRLAADIHPLFVTRGPPGTHDVPALKDALVRLSRREAVTLPRFDKATDDRVDSADGGKTGGARTAVVILEGWCLGVAPDPRSPEAPPINPVEEMDPDGVWRRHQEAQLGGPYRALWDMAAALLYIDAPGFDVVERWRAEQEAETLGREAASDLPAARLVWVKTFVQHYERLTRRLLAGERRPGRSIRIDDRRRPVLPKG